MEPVRQEKELGSSVFTATFHYTITLLLLLLKKILFYFHVFLKQELYVGVHFLLQCQ